MDFIGARDYILKKLRDELDEKLTYHTLAHTLDVHRFVVKLCQMENLTEHTSMIIETAAYYHDSGMLRSYQDHEKYSVDFILETLPGFGYTQEEIEEVSRLIMATRLPQQPKNLGEEIICDADMDNLGRENFLTQSFNLRQEWENFHVRQTSLSEWYAFQVSFLEAHSYFTSSARNLRDEQKQKNLLAVTQLLKK
jgi:uncharacterized protein